MKGKKLRFGDTIGVIMPASPEDDCIIQKHISILKEMGFIVKEGAHLYDKHGYLAGKDEDRARDLTNMFLDDSVDAIMCFRGGYGTIRLLPFIDYKILRKYPKIFIGYSDITILLNYFYEKFNLITFHGPMLNSDLEDEPTITAFYNTLMHGTKPYTLSNPKECPEIYYGSSPAEGVIVGGNLTLLCSTIGTPYEINTRNKLLFIEEVGEAPYRIDRMLTQLLMSGKLHDCRGIILGQFTDCSANNPDKSLSLEDVLTERILSLNKPTIMNFMSGHDYPKITLPIGAKAQVDPCNKKFEILQAVVKD